MNKAVSKEDVVAQIKITDLAKEFSINLEPTTTANFDFKCKCPSKDHKNGQERTGSCFIDSNNNSFHCYGCGQGFNSIDFYILCANSNFTDAFQELKKRVKVGTGITIRNKYNNFNDMLQISTFFRKILLKHPKDFDWIEKLMKRVDEELLKIESDDYNQTKILLQKIKKVAKLRYKESK
jgi:DNA primase